MKKLTALVLALLLACGSIIGCEKGIPGEETTKNPSETVSPKPVETKAPEVPPVEGEIINLADEGILISSNDDANVTDAFDLDISTAVRLESANSDNWIGIELPQPAILCYASFSAQDTDYDGTTNSPWDIYGHIVEGSNDGQNWEFILQFGDPYDEYDDYAVEYENGNNYATEYAFDGESEYDDDATEAKAYRYYRSWNDGKGGPLWGELELWGVLVGEPVETDAPETKAPETKPAETEAPETELVPQGISIQGQKYPYGDKDILILDVENATDTHYTVTLTVTFYNETGKKIKTQKRMIEQLPAESKQPCLFQPGQQFASYTCEVSVEEYTGPDYLSTLSYEKYTEEVRRYKNLPTLDGKRKTVINLRIRSSFGPCTIFPEEKFLHVTFDVVVLDNTGEIYTITQHGVLFQNPATIASESSDFPLISTTEDLDMPIPDELKGEVTVMLFFAEYELVDKPKFNG